MEDATKKYQLVLIRWKDAESDVTWGSQNEVEKWANKDCIINEIGWLVFSTKKYVVICNQISEDGDFGNRTKIPKAWIVKQERIGIASGKRRPKSRN